MPDPASTLWVSFFLLVLLLIFCYLLTAAETAAANIGDSRLKKLAEEDRTKRSALKLLKLRRNTDLLLAKVRVCRIGISMLCGCLCVYGLVIPAVSLLQAARPLWTLLFSLLALLLQCGLIISFGFIIPKNAALKNCERTALALQGYLSFMCACSAPFSALYTGIAKAFMKLAHIPTSSHSQLVSEEEILMMVDEGEETGVLEQNTKDMIENIFDFHDTTANEIMTHRTDVSAVKDSDPITKAVALSIEKGYSRLPVYHDDIDDICGVIYIKDLLRYVGREMNEDLCCSKLMRKAYFVPESKQCGELFQEMTEKHVQFAVIIDEYGGTEGIVTMEDLLESIVGSIQDEYDNEKEEIQMVGKNMFTVDGTISIDEISDLTGVKLPTGDYDTIAGLFMELLGRLPMPDEHPSVQWKNLCFSVEELEERRVSRIRITVKDPPAGKEDEG